MAGNMFLPSLSNMAQSFEIDYATMSLSVALYLAMTGVLQLILGPLSDRYGRRPVLILSMAVFALASIGCAQTDDIWSFLIFRILQGAVASGFALSQAIIRDQNEPREAATLMGYVAMAMAVGPMIGPMAGGVLDEFFGWRANFYAYAALGASALALCWFDVGETNRNRSGGFARQFRAYPTLLRSRVYWGYTVSLACGVGAFFAFVSGVPYVAETVFDVPTSMVGVYMGVITVGFFCGSFLTTRLARKVEPVILVIAGRTVGCLGLSVGLALAAVGVVNELTVLGATVLAGVGNGLTNPNASAGALSVRPELAGSAAGLNGALIVVIGAVLTSLTGAVVGAGYGAAGLLGVMLATTSLGLLAALVVLFAEREQPAPVAEG